MTIGTGVAITGFGVLLLLAAELWQNRAGVWASKPLASTGFLLAAWGAGASTTPYGRAVLVALVLSWWGDVLLIPRSRGAFLAGLVSFLLGHVAFVAAFVVRGLAVEAMVIAIVLLAVPAFVVWRWLRPHLPGSMKVPVAAYVSVITVMVATAISTTVLQHSVLIPVGALAFYLSDLSVARDRFVASGFSNRAWGLPLYYGAQLLLAASCTAAIH